MRSVHIVGSIPADSTADALGLVTDTVGEQLRYCVSDGETGPRWNWTARITASLKTHPDLVVVKDGDQSSFEETLLLAVRDGHEFGPVQLDYLEAFRESWREFDATRQALGRDLALMVGIPGHIDLSTMAFGWAEERWKPNLEPFLTASVGEIRAIWAEAGDEVVFQLEIPVEMAMLVRLAPSQWEEAAANFAAEVVRIPDGSPASARFGFHLCWGDLQWASDVEPDDATPIVLMANALLDRWPADRTLEYIHAPLAVGFSPPATNHEYYEPLRDLRLPGSVRFIGGFIHEGRSLEELYAIRDIIEGVMGREIDIASSCGLGRRDRAEAVEHMSMARLVATHGEAQE